MTIITNTREYEFSHGKRPRGRGSWAFEIAGEVHWSAPSQLYSDAVRDMRKIAFHSGVTEIKVLP